MTYIKSLYIYFINVIFICLYLDKISNSVVIMMILLFPFVYQLPFLSAAASVEPSYFYSVLSCDLEELTDEMIRSMVFGKTVFDYP